MRAGQSRNRGGEEFIPAFFEPLHLPVNPAVPFPLVDGVELTVHLPIFDEVEARVEGGSGLIVLVDDGLVNTLEVAGIVLVAKFVPQALEAHVVLLEDEVFLHKLLGVEKALTLLHRFEVEFLVLALEVLRDLFLLEIAGRGGGLLLFFHRVGLFCFVFWF